MIVPTLALALAAAWQTTPATPTPTTPTPAPSVSAPAASDAALTDAEQKTLKRCRAMGPGQAAQSSKCSAVMRKAGQPDPSKQRAAVPN